MRTAQHVDHTTSHSRPHRWALMLATAAVAGVTVVGCGGSTGGSADQSSAGSADQSAAAEGGTYATELVGQTDFADEPDAAQTGKQALQQVTGGKLVLTNNGPGLAWQSQQATSEPGSPALFVEGDLAFTAQQLATGAPVTAAGVGVGTASNTWDYFLTCNTAGVATLQRSSDTDAIKLAEYDDVGCGQNFTLGLEAHTPANANTELLLTLPDGSKQTVADDADYGPFMYYGFMVYGDQYPATASATSGGAYMAPQ
ncbi:MAG: hypothetical protein QG597_4884 [Actinomycetota bacterium]|nr:hypothetical protein [Actinomycetota bacterium]